MSAFSPPPRDAAPAPPELAIEHFKLYLAENPRGPTAERVQQHIAELRKKP